MNVHLCPSQSFWVGVERGAGVDSNLSVCPMQRGVAGETSRGWLW